MDELQPLYTASHALVIGIDTYGDPRFVPLGAAETDARAVASILAAPPNGFQVRTLFGKQATRAAILEELFKLRQTGPNDRVLVYFAGHGYTLSNRFGAEAGYLAAADTIPEQDFTALQLAEVTNLRLHAGAKHIGFIFDACFSGQVLGLTRSPAIASDKFLLRRAYQVISAGAGDQTVLDFHSMTDVLVAALGGGVDDDDQPLTFSRLGLHLQQTMAADSNQTQIPQFGHLQGSQGGELVLEADDHTTTSEWLAETIASSSRHVGLAAVDALIGMAADPNPDRASYARQWLARMAKEDKVPDVRAAAARFFEPQHAAPSQIASTISTPAATPFREVDVLSGWARLRARLAPHAPILTAILGWSAGWLIWWLLLVMLDDAGVNDPFVVPTLISGALGGLTLSLAIRQIAPQKLWHVLLLMLVWALVLLVSDRLGRQVVAVITDPTGNFSWRNLSAEMAGLLYSVIPLPLEGLLGGLATGVLLTTYYRGMRWSQAGSLVVPWVVAYVVGGWMLVLLYAVWYTVPGHVLTILAGGAVGGLIGGGATLRQVRKAMEAQ